MDVQIIIALLSRYDFPQETIESLKNISGLKHTVRDYLLALLLLIKEPL